MTAPEAASAAAAATTTATIARADPGSLEGDRERPAKVPRRSGRISRGGGDEGGAASAQVPMGVLGVGTPIATPSAGARAANGYSNRGTVGDGGSGAASAVNPSSAATTAGKLPHVVESPERVGCLQAGAAHDLVVHGARSSDRDETAERGVEGVWRRGSGGGGGRGGEARRVRGMETPSTAPTPARKGQERTANDNGPGSSWLAAGRGVLGGGTIANGRGWDGLGTAAREEGGNGAPQELTGERHPMGTSNAGVSLVAAAAGGMAATVGTGRESGAGDPDLDIDIGEEGVHTNGDGDEDTDGVVACVAPHPEGLTSEDFQCNICWEMLARWVGGWTGGRMGGRLLPFSFFSDLFLGRGVGRGRWEVSLETAVAYFKRILFPAGGGITVMKKVL